jgi:hypothetical protein
MGNRASIGVEGCSKKIYLQWNGGRGSVQAFIEEANKRYCASKHGKVDTINIKDDTYLFFLFAAIREYFDFAGDRKYRGRDTLSLYLCDEPYTDENGHYVVKNNGEIDFSHSRYIESKDYTSECYDGITAFYAELESVLVAHVWDGDSEEDQ